MAEYLKLEKSCSAKITIFRHRRPFASFYFLPVRTQHFIIDLVASVVLFTFAIGLYGTFALRLAQGIYSDYLNLAFDFDPYLMLSLLTEDPPEKLGFKHPLLFLLRPLGLGLTSAGLPAKAAAGMVMSAFGAGAVVLVWWFLRVSGSRRIESFFLALLFTVSSTSLFTAMIPESYGVSLFAIVLVWLVTQLRLKIVLRSDTHWRYVGSLIMAGATITNVVQAFIIEFILSFNRSGMRTAVRRIIRFGFMFGILFLLLVAVVWHTELWKAAQNPLDAARKVWWLQTKGAKTGLLKVLETFLGFSFVAPNYTFVLLPETTNMRDFRDWSFTSGGFGAMALWLLFLLVGTVCSFLNREYRTLAAGLVVALIFNILLHLTFQFRGSVFLYAAHAHFLVFALGSGTAVLVANRPRLRILYVSVLILTTALVAINNIPVAAEFSAGFDKPNTACKAPCL